MEKLPFKETRSRAVKPMERINVDGMGLVQPTSIPGGNRFIYSFTDDYSRLARSYATQSKSEAGICLGKCLMSMRNIQGEDKEVCYIRGDNALEFVGGKFLDVMQREKIEPDFAIPYTPEHNGLAERINKTL